MAIVKKRDTELMEQKNELKSLIEENHRKMIWKLKSLEDQKRYINKRNEELKEDKRKNRRMILFKSFFTAIFIFIFFSYLLKHILLSFLISVYVFFKFKNKSWNALLKQIECDSGLLEIENKIFTIKSEFRNKNENLKRDLSKIEKGFEGEYEVARLIEENLSDRFVLLNDVTIPTPDSTGTTQIDHILITPKRIICIETKSSEGIYYPSKNGWMWYPTSRQRYGKTCKGSLQDNPINQATYHSRKLYNFLLSKKVEYKVDAIVVLSNPNSKYKGPNGYCPVLSIDKLIEYLKIDDDVDVHIDRDMLNKISEFLMQTDEQFSELHYEKYNKKASVNI